ncbi:hypothetical protein [Nocardioides sp.]|uniref:hypothetical protein n=1 Tax=Nocardioides sp. TaxID=35761 RepID=UPI00352763F9
MADLETLLRESFSAAGEGAPEVAGLAAAAQRRSRRRRTVRAVVGSGAAVAAVSVGLVWVNSSPPAADREVPTTFDSPLGSVPSGWRVETWRDLTMRVPADWGYGDVTQWCVGSPRDGSDIRPVVQRPEGASTDVGCVPQVGYGLVFGTDDVPAGPFPEGAWTGSVTEGHGSAFVIAPTEELGREILGSARAVSEDRNGCWTTAELRDGNRAGPADVVRGGAVCRYDADGWLVQSEHLSAGQAARALDAVRAAPLASADYDCPQAPVRWSTVVLRLGDDALREARVVWESDCPGNNGVFLSGVRRQLTADVLYWALSPGWSGGLPGDVPLPDHLRRR